jgi:hypothetical protein
VNQVASILFAFLLLWHPSTPAANNSCGGETAMACARCCACCMGAIPDSTPVNPLAPVQSRLSANEQFTLLMPTTTASLMLEQSSHTSTSPKAELSGSAGALPLFQRDCALLL